MSRDNNRSSIDRLDVTLSNASLDRRVRKDLLETEHWIESSVAVVVQLSTINDYVSCLARN